MESIRKVTFTASSRVVHYCVKRALSIMLLWPRTKDEEREIEDEYQRRQAAARNISLADLKRAEKTLGFHP